MVFLFNRVIGIQDEENVVVMVYRNIMQPVFTISQDFIVDLIEKYEWNNHS